MSKFMRSMFGVAVVGCISVTAVVSAALAETVTLRLNSGGISIEGDLVSFDGEAYVIRSRVFGTMSLDADKFDCVGAACPETEEWNPYVLKAENKASKAAPVAKTEQQIWLHPQKPAITNPYKNSPIWQALTGKSP